MQACSFQYPLNIELEYSSGESGSAEEIVRRVLNLLNNQPNKPLYLYNLKPGKTNRTSDFSTILVNVQDDAKIESAEASLRSLVPVLDVRHNPKRSDASAALVIYLANQIRQIFDYEESAMSHTLMTSPFAPNQYARILSDEVKAALDARSTKAFKYASNYHLTFSLFTSSASPSAWDVEQAFEETVRPLLDRLGDISHFTVDTQVQLYAAFSPSIAGPQYDTSTREWKLQRSDLSGFVNAAEWPLGPGIGSGPTINFVLYVPSKEQSPMVLAETGGNSWVIPQWGGVQILNPTGMHPEALSVEDLRPVMITFADQLSSLLGIPRSPASLSMRISSLTRERATSLILSASSTLGALARLTLKLKSIAIPDSVAKSVDETIYGLEQACQNLNAGHYQSALANARIAEAEAEKAFFEPSMVGQVYFPDEHKVAVYVPLLGPMAVPLFMAGLKEIAGFVKSRRQNKSKMT